MEEGDKGKRERGTNCLKLDLYIRTCPTHSQGWSKSTYSLSLLNMPRATLVASPFSSSLNLRLAMLSNSLAR